MTTNQDQHYGRLFDQVIEQMEFNAIFGVVFLFLLVGASLALLLPWTWPRRFQSKAKPWFVERAWQDASSFTGLAFMG